MADDDVGQKQSGLRLIGMGPGSVGSMTTEAISAAKSADFRRYEAYTALWPDEELSDLEQLVGPIERVMRPEIENPEEILGLAKNHVVAVLIVGDPLQATTHVDLQLQASEHGIECEIIHGISITNLVTGAIGLSNYKFGRQTTLTYPYSGWIATSPLEVIAVNRGMGLHTLALLDLDPTGAGTGEQRPMQPKDAVESLNAMANKLVESVEDMPVESPFERLKVESVVKTCSEISSLNVVLCSDMGTEDQSIVTTTVDALVNEQGGRLNCLVFPAITSDVEEKALLRWIKEE
jgi:diphthine synthase